MGGERDAIESSLYAACLREQVKLGIIIHKKVILLVFPHLVLVISHTNYLHLRSDI